MEGLTAFILAGGKSTRMGTDKAFLELRGRSLLANALATARAVAAEVRIVGDAAKFSAFGTVIQDVYPDCGPLGGIHAGLTSSQTELNLMLAVDLPFVDTSFLEYLTGVAAENDAVVTVPGVKGFYEPLCAVYRNSFAALADEALRASRNKVDALFSDVPIRVIGEDELAEHGFSPAMFRNVNTPEIWKEVQEAFVNRPRHL